MEIVEIKDDKIDHMYVSPLVLDSVLIRTQITLNYHWVKLNYTTGAVNQVSYIPYMQNILSIILTAVLCIG